MTKQATNRIAIHRLCGTVGPIERRQPVVISGIRISAALEEQCDRLHEASFRTVMEAGRPAFAIVCLAAKPFDEETLLGLTLVAELSPKERS